MTRREEYVQVEKERICELLQGIDQLEVLGLIYNFTASILKELKGGN